MSKTKKSLNSMRLAQEASIKSHAAKEMQRITATADQIRTEVEQAGKKALKPKAAIFIDFECWYIGLKKLGLKPAISNLFNDLQSKYEFHSIQFFADFSRSEFAEELPHIRAWTNLIVDTRNTNPVYEKEYTDAFIFDAIYQSIIRGEEYDTLILLSGDNHFASALTFLKYNCNKKIVVYGLSGSFGNQLKMAADESIELPLSMDYLKDSAIIILTSLRNQHSRAPSFNFYFNATVNYITSTYDLNEKTCNETLSALIKAGYIQKEALQDNSEDDRDRRVLTVNWDKCVADGLLPKYTPAKTKFCNITKK